MIQAKITDGFQGGTDTDILIKFISFKGEESIMKKQPNNKTSQKLFNWIAYIIAAGIVITCIAVPVISFTGNNRGADADTPVTKINTSDDSTGNTEGGSDNAQPGTANVPGDDSGASGSTADSDSNDPSGEDPADKNASDSNTTDSNTSSTNNPDNSSSDSRSEKKGHGSNSSGNNSSNNSNNNNNSTNNNSDNNSNNNDTADSNPGTNDNSSDNKHQTLDEYEATGKDNEISFDMFE